MIVVYLLVLLLFFLPLIATSQMGLLHPIVEIPPLYMEIIDHDRQDNVFLVEFG